MKKVRAELNSEFSALEQSRIAAKKAVMEPYEKLEAIYKTCVTDVYGPANEQLGSKIADVENGLKEAKKEKVKAYFEECCVAANIDWLKYEQAEITVTLSASEKSLKEKAKSFVSRIASEIGLIETQEHADEIMVEYKQTLLLADSIRLIQRRYEALQKEKEKKQRLRPRSARSVPNKTRRRQTRPRSHLNHRQKQRSSKGWMNRWRWRRPRHRKSLSHPTGRFYS